MQLRGHNTIRGTLTFFRRFSAGFMPPTMSQPISGQETERSIILSRTSQGTRVPEPALGITYREVGETFNVNLCIWE